jgi:hypothetical protein
MKQISHYTLSIIAALAFAGCGAHVAPIGMTDAASARAPHMASSSGNDLLYGSVLNRPTVTVFTYPEGVLQATFNTPNDATASGECADANGDVFVTAYTGASKAQFSGYVFEYEHGATSPSTSLSEGAYEPVACSVDPTTGNLAIANFYYNQSQDTAGNVAIFAGGQGQPSFFTDSAIQTYDSVTYDGEGNLYVLGYTGGTQPYRFAELAAGSGSFTNITVPVLKRPLRIQWDGKYVGFFGGRIGHGKHSHPIIYRMAISGSSGTVVGRTTFRGLGDDVGQGFWIQGKQVVLQDGHLHGHEMLGIFDYPAGGKPTKTIKYSGNDIFDFAVSVGGTH